MTAPCVFCEILWDRAPATILRSFDESLVIEPLNPVTPGHALVIPRVHVVDARESPAVTATTFRDATAYLQQMAHDQIVIWQGTAQVAAIEDFNLITSGGPSATQTVEHLHVHVVPRRKGDGLHLPWTNQHVHEWMSPEYVGDPEVECACGETGYRARNGTIHVVAKNP